MENIVVMKFGGTSVQDADAIRRVAQIVAGVLKAGGRLPVVIVSAMALVTDGLLSVANSAKAGTLEGSAGALTHLQQLQTRHLSTARNLFDTRSGGFTQADLARVEAAIYERFAELERLVRSVAELGELTPRTQDAIVSMGERLSSLLVAAAFQIHRINRGLVEVDARSFMVTDDQFGSAHPNMDEINRYANTVLHSVIQSHAVPVTQGFIGATMERHTTTLGRGGSDYSAAIIGAAIGAEEIQIWTDVNGMLTADPRIVPNARVVPQMSFGEASELAYFGAKVLHPSTILPAVKKGIPVRILNSLRPEQPGTLISNEAGSSNGPITGISCKRNVTVVDITSTRMLDAHGFLAEVFEVFKRFKTAIDVVTTSEVSVSVTLDDVRAVEMIREALAGFAEVQVVPEMAIISVVGEKLHDDPTIPAQVLTALGNIPLKLVSQAASRRNFTFVLRDDDAPTAMVRLHDRFF